ncbi:MAG TPA: toll/interleukin-1 receptor domain-containing protein [Thermoanaerobaculia bacterium]|nr:toll/interleukin-1 receptor domain-containing protein [Thermoanaerobaculia bacterium]
MAFPHARLDGIKLDNANLLQANLEGASLVRANLRNSNLKEANLRRANLQEADLEEANLYGAKLQDTSLERAILRHANLLKADFERTKLTSATFGYTSFDHRIIEGGLGLDAVYHAEHSIVDAQIFLATAQFLRRKPELMRPVQWFFQNAQIPDLLTKGAFEIWSQKREWSTCFVSYSHKDKEFAARLSASLEHEGIICWRDDRSMSLGSGIFEEVRSAIVHQDRTLICCSQDALTRPWVNEEANVALEKEKQTGKSVVLPIDIDGCLIEKPDSPEASPLVERLMRRLVLDFRGWNDPWRYKMALHRLTEELRLRTS